MDLYSKMLAMQKNKTEAKERDIMIMMIVIAATVKKASKITMKDERKIPLIKKVKYVQKIL